MCVILWCPTFDPHIFGIGRLVEVVVVNESWHAPPPVSLVSAGPLIKKFSKSSLN